EAEAARFARQMNLAGVGPAALDRFRAARVRVVGAGATAGPALLFLAQAGVARIYLDDGADVTAEDAKAWLYGPDQVGQHRLFAAIEALRGASALAEVRPHATGTLLTATLVCSETEMVARKAADEARRAGLPHVVALASGDGGEVVAVPIGAPCFNCASRPAARLPPRRGSAAAVGTLGALELLLLIAGAVSGGNTGRRIELAAGWPKAEPTARNPTCECRFVH
ncbi:MAG TPA: ThiF family adenylyltransferase, partial [Anaeromyxobacter sp.]